MRSLHGALALGLAALATPLAATPPPTPEPGAVVVVGSKNFAESRLLGELFSQLLERRTALRIERRLGLAGTQVCFEALRSGAIDLYPEYTGTGLASLLGEPPTGGAAAAMRRVRAVFLRRWNLRWLAPLGFENAYEVAVPRALARREGLATLSDLARIAPRLRAGFGYEFAERPDGLPGLAARYGLHFASVQRMQQALKYRAAGEGRVDVLDVYTTDGRLLRYDLQVLRDDLGFFPPYAAAPLVREATLAAHPEIASTLGLLAGALDAETMRALNFRLQEDGATEREVAREALRALDLAVDEESAGRPQVTGRPGLLDRLWGDRQSLLRRTREHLVLSALALLLGVLVALPLGLVLAARDAPAELVIRLVGTTQTVPSIALLAFMIPFLGIGAVPALVALWIYTLFPILRNTTTGVRDAGPDAVEAATALGMTPSQVLWRVRLPLAAPVILAGVRTAAVLTVGTATLAAFIGAGGLGEPIVTGLQMADTPLILSGALPAALLAVLVDLALAGVERLVRPRGLASEEAPA